MELQTETGDRSRKIANGRQWGNAEKAWKISMAGAF